MGDVLDHCLCQQSITCNISVQGTLGMSINITETPLLEISLTDTPAQVWNHLCTKSLTTSFVSESSLLHKGLDEYNMVHPPSGKWCSG